MAKKLIIVYLISLCVSAAVTFFLIPLLKRAKINQTILKYVTEHYSKNGTPTMGGIGFVVTTAAVYLFSVKSSNISAVSLIVFLLYALIGFSDDFIKIKYCKNEGLTPWQKISFQTIIAIISALFCGYNGLNNLYIPFTDKLVNAGFWFYPLCVFIFLATCNCVNLTDGLDGLAGTVSSVVLSVVAVMILLQTEKFGGNYLNKEEYEGLSVLAISSAGSLVGYLLFNVNKASVFMGDTGSLALGGLIASVYTFSGNALYIPLAGVTFVLSGVSVIVQVLNYKRTKKRIFLMAPLHHHFQHKGYAESKIVFWYFAITLVVGLLCVLNFV